MEEQSLAQRAMAKHSENSAEQESSAGEAMPTLRAMTPEAKSAIRGDERLRMHSLPFRFGRECRYKVVHGKKHSLERRDKETPEINDFYLIDRGKVLNVSREHFLVDRSADGYVLVDRCSTCGTIVDGDTVGGCDKGGRHALADGSTIVVGSPESPYIFRFELA